MTHDQIISIAQNWLNSQPWGRSFRATSVETTDFIAICYYSPINGDLVAGNGPLLIDLRNGRVTPTGSGHPVSYFIHNFLYTGDPYLEPVTSVKIVGWRVGANSVSAIMLLKNCTNLGLAKSKEIIESILNDGEFEIPICDTKNVDEICARFESIGFIAQKSLVSPNENPK